MVPPRVTVAKVRPVVVPPKPVYRLAAPAPAAGAVKFAALPWWGSAVNLGDKGSLTFSGAYDDSANVYVQPTVKVDVRNTENLSDSSSGITWPGVGLSGRTNGQLIGISQADAYSCSATVVHSPQRNVVLTAAHCAWIIPVGKSHREGGAEMAHFDDLYFIPGASDISRPLRLKPAGQPEVDAPFGIWRVNSVSTNKAWLENTWVTRSGTGENQVERVHGDGAFDDVAFLTVESRGGHNIEQVTGGQGILFSDNVSAPVTAKHPTVLVGYPGAKPFDGTSQRYCADASPTVVGDSNGITFSVECDMTQGSSGGAWFAGYDQKAGAGYVYGVTSRGGRNNGLTAGLLSVELDYPLYRKLTGG